MQGNKYITVCFTFNSIPIGLVEIEQKIVNGKSYGKTFWTIFNKFVEQNLILYNDFIKYVGSFDDVVSVFQSCNLLQTPLNFFTILLFF